MKRLMLIILPVLFISLYSYSQANNPLASIDPNEYRINEKHDLYSLKAAFPVKVSGYVKAESYWDTRQVVGDRSDQVLLYPEKQVLDANCQDINARGQFSMSPIQTRFRFDIDGPMIKNAFSHGVIEYDFFGRKGIANIMRMRLAHLILQWEKVRLIAGQAYHPLTTIEMEARTLSFNSGVPIDSFSRNPLAMLNYYPTKHLELIFCAATELDFPSDGPIGFSTTYMRDAVVPMIDFQLRAHFGEDNLIGVGVDYKRIRPRLKTDTGLKAYETLNSAIAIAFASYNWEWGSTRTKFMFVQNPTDMNMTGGYAVSCIDETCDSRTYTNLNGIALWNDTEFTNGKSVVPGWFVGFIKNLGSRDTVLPNVVNSEGEITERRIFGFGTDIDYTFRFSPRIAWKVHNFLLGVELEWTRSAFGTIDCTGDVINTTPVNNVRLLFALYYYL